MYGYKIINFKSKTYFTIFYEIIWNIYEAKEIEENEVIHLPPIKE